MLLDHSEGKIDFNARTDFGFTAFMLACIEGNKDVVKMLLDHSEGKIDFNERTDFRWTAFMMACSNRHKDVVQLLLKCAKAKGIQIPSSQSLLDYDFSKEIKNLIDEYQAEK